MIEQEVTVGDDRQKVAIQVEKQDAENGATVEKEQSLASITKMISKQKAKSL